jgi:peptide deformylase
MPWMKRANLFHLDADGLLARVIQHELDHLNGVLFIDHLSELKRKRIIRTWEQKFKA